MFNREQAGRQEKGDYGITGFWLDGNVIREYDNRQFNSQRVFCDYDAATRIYTLTFAKDVQSNHMNIHGQFQCKAGDKWWSRIQGAGTINR